MLFFFQAEDGIRDLVRSRGLGDVYKRQAIGCSKSRKLKLTWPPSAGRSVMTAALSIRDEHVCLLYTSDAADERSSVDLGGRRIIKKKKDRVS